MKRSVELVIKVGGSLAREQGLAERLRPIKLLSEQASTLVVPGGGPFSDSVRAASARHGFGESAAHWMAILGMDQHAYLLADLLAKGAVVRRPVEIFEALGAGSLPVLAPFEWVRSKDPLPHDWSVTGDSIAAWVAGQLGARKLILVKSRSDRAGVDFYFSKALPSGLDWQVVTPESAAWRSQ